MDVHLQTMQDSLTQTTYTCSTLTSAMARQMYGTDKYMAIVTSFKKMMQLNNEKNNKHYELNYTGNLNRISMLHFDM